MTALACALAACSGDVAIPVAPVNPANRAISVGFPPGGPAIGCAINAPGSDACASHVTTTISPFFRDSALVGTFFTGTPVHARSFYNASGTLPPQSAPIHISFSRPVSVVGVRANTYLPTPTTVRLVAHEVGGADLEAVLSVTTCFIFSHCDGRQVVASDIGLEGIDIIPTESDTHLGFTLTLAGFPSTSELVLTCPAQVVRGTEMSCTASSSAPEAAVAVTHWRFHPDDPALGEDISPADGSTPNPWSGIMATSGTVVVNATVNGEAKEASAHVEVTPRPDWASKKVEIPPPPVSDDADMSEKPYQEPGEKGLRQIAHTHTEWYAWHLQGNLFVIPSGPNAGLTFLQDIPYAPLWQIHINFSQLRSDSSLGKLQSEARPVFESVQMCRRSQMSSLVEPIEVHEGTTMHEKSHAGRYARKLNELAGSTLEPVVIPPDADPNAVLDNAFAPVFKAADQESHKADEDFKPKLCALKLFPAPRGSQ
ncbi:MAG TPA: hypothetical protein VFK13_09925 [Gemmatimonadaceae bacterium]|nr:hypothetical protein [Gemmatimonadaceae bacterium]